MVGAGGSGMSGRALKLPGRLGRAMFAGAEREFLAVDAVRRDAVIIDPAGAPQPLLLEQTLCSTTLCALRANVSKDGSPPS